MVEIPSEQTTQGQRDERHRQEVGDSVEVEWREGHCGDGQGQREAGGQRQEFTGRGGAEVEAESRAGQNNSWGTRAMKCSHLFRSFKVLQLISSM